MAGRLEGKVGLISGGARGIGATYARRFVEEGASVVITDLLETEGEAVATELGDAARFVKADVTSEAHWSAAVAEATSKFGGVDVLVNNAGIVRVSPIAATSLSDYMDVINVNQVGVLLGMKAVIPAMSAAGRGSIINISSVEGLAASPYVVGYVASKFAVRGMTKCAAIELAPLGIRVNSIHPGGIDTEMIRPGGFDTSEYFATVPMGRIGEPDEVAAMAIFLASDESSYCTGAEFLVDGGMMAPIIQTPSGALGF